MNKAINEKINFPKTERIEVVLRLRQDLADRLPEGKSERNTFISQAVEHELERRKGEN